MGNQMMRDGQRASRQDEDVRRCLWVGPIVGANRSRIPACWDELLDWTIDASQIFDLFLQTRSSEANVAEEQEGNSKSNAKINFVPYALHTQAEHIRALPSMEYCDQEKFLFENVIIVVVKGGQPPGILTVGTFAMLYSILSRYWDLIILLKSKMPEGRKDECSICFETDSNTIVLPCSHVLCSNCFDQWVSRRLNCPYCRYQFQKNSVRKNPWEILDFNVTDVLKDVKRLEIKLERFWGKIDFATTSPGILEAYTTRGPTMKTREQNGTVIVDSVD